MSKNHRPSGMARLLAASLVVTSVAALSTAPAPATTVATAAANASAKVTVAMRRLTESQYRHIIRDTFGDWVTINARFEPERRQDGLLAVGSTNLSITSTGFEQYYSAAQSIADQVLAQGRRDSIVPCTPASSSSADDGCAEQFIRLYGEQLFRRPLSEAEVSARVATARAGGEAGDFYDGLELALTSMLIAPEFMFRIETAERDPATGELRLDPYTQASRISFLLWDAGPDSELLAAAQSGDLASEDGLQRQIDRLAASPRLEDGVRAFFADMLQVSAFEGLTKDPAIYPKFSQAVANSAREETMRTVIDQLVTKERDYRELFTTQETWINRNLASVYKVPFASKEDWATYRFPDEAGRSGILTQVTFLSLFSHPGRSSPTIRGVKLFEIFLGQPTPEPPADVDFSKVEASNGGTVRGRLIDHMTNDGCTACHSVSDPAGLTLEHFDSLGQHRTMEDGRLIDVSGILGGKEMQGAQGLGQFLYDNPRTPATLVRTIYYYGVGRGIDERDDGFLAEETEAFAATGYKVPALFAQIAASPHFMKVVVPRGARRPSARVAASSQ